MPGPRAKTTAPLDAEQMRAWQAFITVSTRVLTQLDHELVEAHGLSLADYEILSALSDAPDRRLQMSQLAASALLTQSRLTYRVDRLVKEDLVERVPCPEDGRRIWAQLTKKGDRKLLDAYPTHLEGVRRYVIDPPATRDLASIRRAMTAMLQALDDAGADAKVDCEDTPRRGAR